MIAPITCNELSNIVADSSKMTEHNTYRISTRQKNLPADRTDFYGNFKYK
jgi:hypothetical protein